MLLLDRYIWKTILQSWLMVMFVLLGLDMIFAFIDQLDGLKNDYQILQAFIYVLATLPHSAFELVSMATLLACLIGLGQLAGNSELVILRACGLSISRILFSVIQPVFLLIFLALCMAQFVSPVTSQFAESYRASKTGGSDFSSFEKGYWQREGDNFVYINQIDEVGLLRGVSIFSFDKAKQLTAFNSFKTVDIENEKWLANDVSSLNIQDKKVSFSSSEKIEWQSDITLRMLRLLAVGPEKLSVSSLYQYGGYLEKQNQNADKYYLAFWNMIFLPLSTIAMVLIAGSFVFGSLRETPMGSRLIVGVVIALVFNQVQTLSSLLAVVYQLNALYAALAPPFIALLIGLFMINRMA